MKLKGLGTASKKHILIPHANFNSQKTQPGDTNPAMRLKSGYSSEKHALTSSVSHSVKSNSLQPYGLQPTKLLRAWDFPGNTGVCCHFLLQGIFLTQGSNPGIPQYSQILYCLSYHRNPGALITHVNFNSQSKSSKQFFLIACYIEQNTLMHFGEISYHNNLSYSVMEAGRLYLHIYF